MDTYGYPWISYLCIPMDTYGNPWKYYLWRVGVTINTYGYLWIPMDTYGYLWIPMDTYGYLWIPMDTYGYLWIPIDTYGYLWIPMDTYGYLWIPMDTYGYLWSMKPDWSIFRLFWSFWFLDGGCCQKENSPGTSFLSRNQSYKTGFSSTKVN